MSAFRQSISNAHLIIDDNLLKINDFFVPLYPNFQCLTTK